MVSGGKLQQQQAENVTAFFSEVDELIKSVSGVISGIGKGVIASSTGLLLKTIGLKVSSIKIDPYLNVDAGTMSPLGEESPRRKFIGFALIRLEHGEAFVLDDGGEVDLDLGNYERYLNITLTRDNNITTGKIYKQVIEEERKGSYLGKTVQGELWQAPEQGIKRLIITVVPHITNAIQDWIERVAKVPVDDTNERPDACIIELGGVTGD